MSRKRKGNGKKDFEKILDVSGFERRLSGDEGDGWICHAGEV
jgi:hypothetical protein